jgi:hypothetical protein
MKTIHIPPLGWWVRFADWAMIPVMYFVSGTLSEAPQRTHCWNNKKLARPDAAYLWPLVMVHSAGILGSTERWWRKMPIFHMPIFGGWKHYVVLEPLCSRGTPWHVGWIAHDVIGVSQIVAKGPVRVLLGSETVSHFGLNTDGTQVPVRKIGEGTIGDEGKYAQILFL